MKGITPSLWFNNNAEEAIDFYKTVFDNVEVLSISRYTEAGPGPAGQVVTAEFRIAGQKLIAINAGSEFPFTEAISFVIHCESQDEVDYYWEKLTHGGEESQCGWLKDRFGLSWQVVPTALMDMLQDKDPVKAARVTQAMLQMRKIDIPTLEAARDQVPA
jgi:predicted 3-demethylubiquinone-9 3-methyltransferase (glyoxalase superfamily)